MRKKYRVDHRHLFVFGYFFYLLTPIIIGETNLFEGLPGIELYRGLYSRISPEKILMYVVVSLLWLPAFLLGHYCFKLFRNYSNSIELYPASAATYNTSYISILLFITLILFTYLGRASLFAGYSSYDTSARGKLSTLLMIFNFFFLYQLVSKQKLSSILALGLLLNCMVLLSMGGRMYVFQTFVIYLVFKTSFSSQPWRLGKLILFLAFGLVVGAAFGLWRMGSNLGLEKSLYSFFAEPTFTWFSTTSYLSSNEPGLFSFPSNFLTSFLNLIPNTFFSFKPYIVSTASMVNEYQNPLGADSIWSTLVINFGTAGSVLFIFFMGFILNFLKYMSTKSRFWAVYYILVCGMLPFQFFRDGFYILNKQLFFNFLLLPSLLIIVTNLVAFVSSRRIVDSSTLKNQEQF